MKFVSVTSTSVTVPVRPATAMSDGYGAAGAVDGSPPEQKLSEPVAGMRIPVLLENVAADAGPASAANAAAHAMPVVISARPC